MKRQKNVLVYDLCSNVRDKCGFTFTRKSITLLGFRCLRPPSSHFRLCTSQSIFLYVHFNKLILYPSSPPVSILIACSTGMLKVTQGSGRLIRIHALLRLLGTGSFDVQGCQLGSREHLTCRCQLGPKPSLRTRTHTHTLAHKHSRPSPRPPAVCCIMKTVKVEEGKSVFCAATSAVATWSPAVA